MKRKNKIPTGLEALDNLRDYGEWLPSLEMVIIRRELKALEIIKEKKVNIHYFQNACVTMNYEQYFSMWNAGCFVGIQMTSKTMLTQEEFDLLKEVLCGL